MTDIDTIRFRPTSYHRGEDTRRRILDTAIEVFAAVGYEAASTRALAERAGVNLPAIPYYFGSKEGLYRAAIEHIVREIDQRMAPVAARVDAALAGSEPSRKELLALLHEMLDAFVALVVGGAHLESRRLLFARAEIERTGALEPLHEIGLRRVFAPCRALVARLLDQPGEHNATALRTLAILGQVSVFCNSGPRRVLGCGDFSEEHMRAIQQLVREQTEAIFRVKAGTKS
ncbi:MAG TPA: CerR family C-terminal domain-containing protein [Stellaceae bacterium]|nr:CerR family C-terminal domain-containing protein [Stellaceae bacterium]